MAGRVQGVGFRWSTRDKARELDVVGTVSNRPDGSVEVIACANESQLEAFVTWLRRGPALASVSSVECSNIHPCAYASFSIE